MIRPGHIECKRNNATGVEIEMEVGKVSLPSWARALAIMVGILSIIAGFLVLIFPGLGVLVVVYFLAVALIFIGVERLAAGISGHSLGVKQEKETQTV